MQWQIFALGTNNWQGGGEFAPGSGILHEGQHYSFGELPNVGGRSYSMWPSKTQRTDPAREDYRVFAIEHDIPICESVSPVSSYRWHSMSDAEFEAYRTRLADEVEAFTTEVEAKNGRAFNLFIAHHCFANPAVLVEVNRRRVAKGKAKVPLVVYSHGTGLKMYQNERKGGEEYPLRFYPWMQRSGIFGPDASEVSAVFGVASSTRDAFKALFPEFPADRATLASCGFNQRIFFPQEGATIASVLEPLPPVLPEGFDAAQLCPAAAKTVGLVDGKPTRVCLDGIRRVVAFTGKFADWKRLDSFLKAAQRWEQDPTILTLVIGSGPLVEQQKYAAVAYGELQLQRTVFLGPQPQPVLRGINTIADVGVFPSRDEPFGLVFIECMACGTPVIGAKSGGPVEFIGADVGLLVEETDDNAVLGARIADAVQTALREDWKAAKGARCASYVLEEFSLRAQCQKLLDLIAARFLPSSD